MSVFVLPFRSEGTNAVPDAFIDTLGLFTNQGIRVGPRKSGWAHLPEAVQFERLLKEPALRQALTGEAVLTGDQYELPLTLHDLERRNPRWSETVRGSTNGRRKTGLP